MVCKENKADLEKDTKDKKKWGGRGGWKQGKTCAEKWRNTEAPRDLLITSFSFQEA